MVSLIHANRLDIWSRIFDHLDYKSLGMCKKVCRSWSQELNRCVYWQLSDNDKKDMIVYACLANSYHSFDWMESMWGRRVCDKLIKQTDMIKEICTVACYTNNMEMMKWLLEKVRNKSKDILFRTIVSLGYVDGLVLWKNKYEKYDYYVTHLSGLCYLDENIIIPFLETLYKLFPRICCDLKDYNLEYLIEHDKFDIFKVIISKCVKYYDYDDVYVHYNIRHAIKYSCKYDRLNVIKWLIETYKLTPQHIINPHPTHYGISRSLCVQNDDIRDYLKKLGFDVRGRCMKIHNNGRCKRYVECRFVDYCKQHNSSA